VPFAGLLDFAFVAVLLFAVLGFVVLDLLAVFLAGCDVGTMCPPAALSRWAHRTYEDVARSNALQEPSFIAIGYRPDPLTR